MRARLIEWFRNGTERFLRAKGYEEAALDAARDDIVDWAKSRARSLEQRRRAVGGTAVVLSGPGRVGLRPVEVLTADAGEITVEVLISAVSPGTERAQWLRLPNARPEFPYTPGYSGAGRVLTSGDSRFRAGDRVAVPRLPHASVATVPADWALPIPDGVPLDRAALVYLAIISGYGVQRAEVTTDDHVCVMGAGPIGALAHRLAGLESPASLSVVASSRRREELTVANGATRFLTSSDDLSDLKASVVIEATGDPDAIGAAVTACADGGVIVSLGSPRGRSRFPLAIAATKNIEVIGAHISSLATAAKRSDDDPFEVLGSKFLDALADGSLDVADLVGEKVDPSEILRFYRRLGRGETTAGHLDWRLLDERRRLRTSLAALPAVEPVGSVVSAPPETHVTTRARASRKLRVAVIGCGDIGMSNARAVAAAQNMELCLSHDSAPELARAAADLGGEVAPSLDDALDPERIEAVVLSVPHDLHAPMIERAAEAGLHIVVEKPLAVDLASARNAVRAAERSGVALSTCFPFRYETAISTAHRLVAAGALGRLTGASLVFHADKPDSYWSGGFSGRATSDWRTRPERAGGGVLIMNLTHYIDFLRYLTGVEISRVSGSARYGDDLLVEDSIALVLELEGGGLGSVSASASSRGGPKTLFEIWGEAGTLRVEPNPSLWTEVALDGVVPGRWNDLPTLDPVKPRTRFMERFAAAVLDESRVDISGEDGLAVQAVVEAAYRSVEQCRPVSPAELLNGTQS